MTVVTLPKPVPCPPCFGSGHGTSITVRGRRDSLCALCGGAGRVEARVAEAWRRDERERVERRVG